MGTVTAIGAKDPDDRRFDTISTTAANMTFASSTTTHIGTRASIAFDQWETAIGAAMVAARTSRGVKVNKVGAEWVVSWDAPVLINPTYPQSPGWWQNPVISWGSSIA